MYVSDKIITKCLSGFANPGPPSLMIPHNAKGDKGFKILKLADETQLQYFKHSNTQQNSPTQF
jgi:hypothetical protein